MNNTERTRIAEAKFRTRLTGLNATLLEPNWLGSFKRHRVQCSAGHINAIFPANVNRGQGICITCAGQDERIAERQFRERLSNLGAILLEPKYRGVNKPHKVQCINGHICYPYPAKLKSQRNICAKCSGRDSALIAEHFREKLEEIGAILLEPKYLGSQNRHKARCRFGHIWYPQPSAFLNRKMGCGQCQAKGNKKQAESAFRKALALNGAILLSPEYINAHTPHRVQCWAGHVCSPIPTNIQRGQGICAECSGKVWDIFYVVRHESGKSVKFGITSGTGKPRIANHFAAGYTQVIRFITVPDALAIERAIRERLVNSGFIPIRGREYYDIQAMKIILDTIKQNKERK
jgi:hypothetical protein